MQEVQLSLSLQLLAKKPPDSTTSYSERPPKRGKEEKRVFKDSLQAWPKKCPNKSNTLPLCSLRVVLYTPLQPDESFLKELAQNAVVRVTLFFVYQENAGNLCSIVLSVFKNKRKLQHSYARLWKF